MTHIPDTSIPVSRSKRKWQEAMEGSSGSLLREGKDMCKIRGNGDHKNSNLPFSKIAR